MAIMNPSKLRDVLDILPSCNLSDSKKRAIEAIITKYLNGDIVTVVHGRWVVYTDEDEYSFSEYFKCSICGAAHYNDDNYCPDCGAKMDGEAD